MAYKKPRIYLGCALSNAPQAYKDQIEQLRSMISPDATVFNFLGLQHPNISEVFQWDINCVRRCDAMVADITYPSLGLGTEFGVAVENHKPIITLADAGLAPERLLAFGYWDPMHFKLRYQNIEEATAFVRSSLRELFS